MVATDISIADQRMGEGRGWDAALMRTGSDPDMSRAEPNDRHRTWMTWKKYNASRCPADELLGALPESGSGRRESMIWYSNMFVNQRTRRGRDQLEVLLQIRACTHEAGDPIDCAEHSERVQCL